MKKVISVIILSLFFLGFLALANPNTFQYSNTYFECIEAISSCVIDAEEYEKLDS